ncbi:glycosyltransferase [Saccharophagus sp. K07]|jgi:glycosyltransferase involved in cell wall biosynthesis|uniref:glycosyltransferase n=1 Tax=Saccharophagus sp. K07 TaxID=2283636 RepID=UPI0016524310|nr:glycosyltransferase [Saccharophagus sp. K07]MBC6907392.1 glycosyltransferase [Saccharophagus sp. K07]
MTALSIIVPVGPGAPHLKSFLNHVLLAVAPLNGVEIIVVDSPDNDRADAICRAMGICVYHSNGSRAVQMNIGAAHARGDYLLFLFPECRLPQNFADMWRIVRRRGETWGFFALRFAHPARLSRWLGRGISWRSKISGIARAEQAIFVQHKAWLLTEGFGESASRVDDVAFCRRLRQMRRPFVVRQPVECLAAPNRNGGWLGFFYRSLFKRSNSSVDPHELSPNHSTFEEEETKRIQRDQRKRKTWH